MGLIASAALPDIDYRCRLATTVRSRRDHVSDPFFLGTPEERVSGDHSIRVLPCQNPLTLNDVFPLRSISLAMADDMANDEPTKYLSRTLSDCLRMVRSERSIQCHAGA